MECSRKNRQQNDISSGLSVNNEKQSMTFRLKINRTKRPNIIAKIENVKAFHSYGTHTHICIYTYICMYVYVCVYVWCIGNIILIFNNFIIPHQGKGE